MSFRSDNASEVDPDLRGSVDFNFFESPRKVGSPEKMTNGSGNHDDNSVGNNSVVDKQHGGAAGGHGHGGGEDSKNKNDSEDEYSDDSFSDSGSCTTGCSQRSTAGSRSRSLSPTSPSPRNGPAAGAGPAGSKTGGSKNSLDHVAKSTTVPEDEAGSHHSRSRHSSYSSSSRSRSRSPSFDDNHDDDMRTSSHHVQSKESFPLKIELPDAGHKEEISKGVKRDDSYSDDSYSESESDITDVSPLNSRDPSPKGSPRRVNIDSRHTEQSKVRGRPPRSPLSNKEKDQSEGMGESGTFERDRIDFNLLMQAVIELDKDRFRSDSGGKKVMFIPPHIRKKMEKNYTFNTDKMTDIDRENQRLLHEIMKQNKGRRPKTSAPPTNQRLSHAAVNRKREQRRVQEENLSRPSSSSINRRKQMQKIESENLRILQRLQEVKPTKGLTRNDLIKDYTRQVTYGVPMAGSPCQKPKSSYGRSTSWEDEGAPSQASYQSSQKARPVSAKVRPQSGRVRPQSGKPVRPVSAKVRTDSRPAWDDRW